ncbi:hypothetical protein SAMN05444172_1569 [Burkholderia sp. GAS332]|jgi:hypothetical protein|nr:hypothetical protein SAMN05444172_1569 [Burkholderia sp. GAS332]
MSQAVQVAHLQRIASDNRITLEAKAILFYLVTRPADYRVSIPDLVSLSAQARVPAGEKTIYNRLNELISLGYLTRKLIRRGADYFIHPVPLALSEGDAATVTTGVETA